MFLKFLRLRLLHTFASVSKAADFRIYLRCDFYDIAASSIYEVLGLLSFAII